MKEHITSEKARQELGLSPEQLDELSKLLPLAVYSNGKRAGRAEVLAKIRGRREALRRYLLSEGMTDNESADKDADAILALLTEGIE
jgi:hypothetical protein